MKKQPPKTSRERKAAKPVSAAYGYGLLVKGARPYIGYYFSLNREPMDGLVSERYHEVVRVKISLVRERAPRSAKGPARSRTKANPTARGPGRKRGEK